jgi:uncharacterized membrane protein SpoIIM required for sporulation
MTRPQFVKLRQPDWDRFRQLVERLEKHAWSRLSAAEASEFSQLFRRICSDLATLRSQPWGRPLIGYVNALVGRGHNCFYSAPGDRRRWRVLWRFLAAGFPRVFRKNIWYFVAGALLFFGPFFITWGVVAIDPLVAGRVVPQEQLEQMASMYAKPLGEQGEFGDARAAMAGFYVNNNVGIALMAFGRGILCGLPTVYTLIFNGIVIGAVAGHVVQQSPAHAQNFLSFVVSHGSFELTAIAVAGGAGLMLGLPLVHPGRQTRAEALRTRGLEAVQIALGAAAMLFIAAGIEAFWSPAPIPAAVKYAGGAAMWAGVVLYLGWAGRGAET